MKFYSVEGTYFAKMGDATKHARTVTKETRTSTEVHAVEVSTKRDNILRLLNMEGGDTVFGEIVYVASGRKRRDP